MIYRVLSDGTQVPVLAIGSWEGKWGTRAKDFSDIDPVACQYAIELALELGITHIDTAELYGKGAAELIIGRAIRGANRKDIFITSKVRGDHLKEDQVRAACEGSLERLGTDYLDLYLVHWQNNDVPIAETMEAMCCLVDDGLVRHIGLSNFNLDAMVAAQEVSRHPLAANQMLYNLLQRDKGRHGMRGMESEVLPYCQMNDMIFMAYSPLAKGQLAKEGYEKLDRVASWNMMPQSRVALCWLLSKENVVAVVGSTDPEHIMDNASAVSFNLNKTMISMLENEFAKHADK
ncbi:aldo/keto reductase [Candidatus Woesearchaeota archaeon]|nr:aldo/keto reductase [Candidatus Woesearchaeota archaeon]